MTKKKLYPVLSIAGSDCSGGAGIQADIKTISAHGCYAMAVITSVTAQNTTGVSAIEGISPDMVRAQINAIYDDIYPLSVKTGMLYDSTIVHSVADVLSSRGVEQLVVDPVMMSTSGARLISEEAIDVMVRELFPLAELITPNCMEVTALTGETCPERQARKLIELGCRAVLVKGGDSPDLDYKSDLLMTADGLMHEFRLPAVTTPNTHGTGCTLSSAIASNLAKGMSLFNAISHAKEYIYNALLSGADMKIGHGHGPVDHFYRTDFGCE